MATTMFRKLLVPVVLLIAAVIALFALSYPSVVVSNASTQTLGYVETYTSSYASGYSQVALSTGLAGYSIFTAWYPGNPICDPASNACTPYPTPTATITSPQSATYTYELTVTSQATSLYTMVLTSASTQTSLQNIPPYAAIGVTELEFGIVALIVIAVVGLSMIFLSIRRSPELRTGRERPADYQET